MRSGFVPCFSCCEHYRTLTIPQIEQKARKLSPKQIEKVENYEKEHKSRKGTINALKKDKKQKKAA